jgi:hypothetical protein
MTDTNQQTPATVNQITNEKPNIKRAFTKMSGTIGSSLNGGHNKTIAWFRVMAGMKIENYQIPIQLKMLTPLCPPYGAGLTATAKFYFVPDSRVWKNSEEYYAQNGGSSKTKITKKPTLLNKKIPFVNIVNDQNEKICLTETTQWRDSWISSYLPRIGYADTYRRQEFPWVDNGGASLPDYDACLLRGRIAICNDFERNKQYEGKIQEYDGDTVTDQEWRSYITLTPDDLVKNSMRCRRNNSYYTDYRVDAQGYETDPYNALQSGDERTMMEWANLESQLDELRQQSENAEKNPWDIINEIYGTSRKLSEGKVQLLKTYTFPLNYAHVTQNTYNTAIENDSSYRVLGEQGAYSFTEELIQGMRYWEAIEPGYIHVILTVTADTVFERAFERTAMNVNWDDEYRPSLKDQKLDTLNYLEVESHIGANGIVGGGLGPIGFKRKWTEYGKLPNVIGGDMSTWGYWQSIGAGSDEMEADRLILSQGTHQFYEENAIGTASLYSSDEMPIFNKQYYLDYTDLLINKNQAIVNAVSHLNDLTGNTDILIEGQNQIFYGGKHILTASLPIDEDIISNFTEWGEH